MTMPHLMNCNHDDEGWCLGCVKQMHAELEESRIDAGRWEMNLQACGQRLNVHTDCVVTALDKLMSDYRRLIAAMKHLREHQRGVITTRALAEMLGVSPTQLCDWTALPTDAPPDIVCRRNDIDERCGCKVTNGYRCQVHGDP